MDAGAVVDVDAAIKLQAHVRGTNARKVLQQQVAVQAERDAAAHEADAAGDVDVEEAAMEVAFEAAAAAKQQEAMQAEEAEEGDGDGGSTFRPVRAAPTGGDPPSPASRPKRIIRTPVMLPKERAAWPGVRALPILDWSRRRLAESEAPLEQIVGSEEAEGSLAVTLKATAPRTLWLHDNELPSFAAPPMGVLISCAQPLIVRLNLSGNALGDEGVALLLDALEPHAMAALVSLGLGANDLGDASVVALASRMVGGSGGKDEAGPAAGAKPLRSLRELRLGGNLSIGEDGGLALAKVLDVSAASGGDGDSDGGAWASPLATLHLCHTSVGDAAGAAIARALGGGSLLQVLHLADAGLAAESASAFSAALASGRCRLSELWLGGNALTADGAARLAASLVHCTSLEKLWLDGTQLDDAACPHLAMAITAEGSNLSEIWLGANSVSDDGAALLRDAIQTPVAPDGAAEGGEGDDNVATPPKVACSLRKLWLDHTDGLSGEGASGLVRAARSGPLRMLWLGGRRIGEGEKEELDALNRVGSASTREGEGDRGGGRPPLRLVVDTPEDEMEISTRGGGRAATSVGEHPLASPPPVASASEGTGGGGEAQKGEGDDAGTMEAAIITSAEEAASDADMPHELQGARETATGAGEVAGEVEVEAVESRAETETEAATEAAAAAETGDVAAEQDVENDELANEPPADEHRATESTDGPEEV